jgi:hypothetical protein
MMRKANKGRTKYLTKRALTQRIGFTESSLHDLEDIRLMLSLVTDVKYSRAILIRRALEVYRDHLAVIDAYEELPRELGKITRVRGTRGRPPKELLPVELIEGGI